MMQQKGGDVKQTYFVHAAYSSNIIYKLGADNRAAAMSSEPVLSTG